MKRDNETSPHLASLAMYDGGELGAANDELWAEIARRLRDDGLDDVPRALERALPLAEVWSSDRLLFGQACSFPFDKHLRHHKYLLGAPRYAAPGCVGAEHRSFVIVPARSKVLTLQALRGSRAVINEAESMTGRHLLGDAVAEAGATAGFFGTVATSGSHAKSLSMVATGQADVAALDCVSYAHLRRALPELVAETRTLHETRTTPAPPFVISAACGRDLYAMVERALLAAVRDTRTERARRTLGLLSIDTVTSTEYERTRAIAARADTVFADAA
jgi:ABC-type phosphate/phosphonate transport system substrate-binding protein